MLRRPGQPRPARSDTRRRIANSAAWTLGERIVTLAVSWIISILIANHLGVADFGRLMYALALVTLFGSLVGAGLSGIVVRDLVRKPDTTFAILGTVWAIRLAFGALSLAALVASTYVFGAAGPTDPLVLAILAGGFLLRAGDVIEFWFQSQTQLRYVALANLAGTLVGASAKVAMLAMDASLTGFAAAFAIEQIVAALSLLVTYRATVGPFRRWTLSLRLGRQYIGQSWPLILSGVANSVNLRIDAVLLGALSGSAAVGTYAVAARLSEVWYFVPVALAGAVFPSIVRAKEVNEQLYRRRLQQLYGAFAWGAIAVAVAVTIAAHPVIDYLYDQEFEGAADVLVLHVWTAPFMFMGVLFSRWLIIEGLLISSLVRHGLAAAVNVALNLVLIPKYGPVGAAAATLVSYATAMYFASFLTARTRSAGIDMTLGLLLPLRAGRGTITALRTRT